MVLYAKETGAVVSHDPRSLITYATYAFWPMSWIAMAILLLPMYRPSFTILSPELKDEYDDTIAPLAPR